MGNTEYTAHTVFFVAACWGTLGSTVDDEGKPTTGIVSYEVNHVNDCKTKCDRFIDYEAGCHSFTYCPGSKKCFLYAKKLNKYMKVKQRNDDCASHYNRCSGTGNKDLNPN